MSERRAAASATLAALLGAFAASVAGQGREARDSPASLAIVSPAAGAYLSGPQLLRARIEPEGLAVVRLTFAADGHAVCTRHVPPWECEWDAGDAVVSHSIRAVAVLADGARLVDNVRTGAAGFAPPMEVEVVQVAATVTDGDGRPVRGLAAADFRVFEDEKRREVSHFIDAAAERELVVAVDVSGSMVDAMPICREAVKRFLATLRPVDHVTLLAFNDHVFGVAPRVAEPAARLSAVDRLQAWGSTALHDAVLAGLELLERHRGRRALVLFSDGEDMVSHATSRDVLARVEVSATPVYVIAQGKGMREPALKHVLDRIAGVSGGRAFYTDGIEELGPVFAEIGEELASQYLLAYVPDDAPRDGRWRTIRVEAGDARRRYVVRSRQGYRAEPRRR